MRECEKTSDEVGIVAVLNGSPWFSVVLNGSQQFSTVLSGSQQFSMVLSSYNLQQVLQRFQESGMRLRKSKCSFMIPKVTYLGYIISSEGIYPAPEKVRAIQNAPTPTNLSQLKSFLGLLNFYSRFLPNQSTRLAPLHLLLRNDTSWKWGPKQQEAFEAAKFSLSSSSFLVHYNPDLPLIVSADASSYGVGAVLSHQLDNSTEQPVAFASRTLSPAEKSTHR